MTTRKIIGYTILAVVWGIPILAVIAAVVFLLWDWWAFRIALLMVVILYFLSELGFRLIE